MKEVIIDDEHMRYLVLQRGGISDLASSPQAWRAAYIESLENDMADIRPALPVKSVLDVGGGLSGISILINRESGGGVRVCILDGSMGPASVQAHDVPFNNMTVAADFLRRNGVTELEWREPVEKQGNPVPYDLILSLQAWCFHFPPSRYLDFIEDCCGDGTTIVLDVRKCKPEWKADLVRVFGPPEIAYEGAKFERLRWRWHV